MWRWIVAALAALAAHIAVLVALTLLAPRPPGWRVAVSTAPDASGAGEEVSVFVDEMSGARTREAREEVSSRPPTSATPPPPNAALKPDRRARAPDAAGQKEDVGKAPSEPKARRAQLGDLTGPIPGTLGSSAAGIQLGLRFADALAVVGASPDRERDLSDAIETHLHHALASHDLASGRGPGGAIATAASAVAREIGPNWGMVLLATVIGANGEVLDVELLDAEGAGWAQVPRALLRALRGRSVAVGIAKNGVRVVTKVAAALRLPSGALAPIRVLSPTEPDHVYRDAPMSESSTPAPPGTIPSPKIRFDLADIGAPRRKVVSVQTLSVTPL